LNQFPELKQDLADFSEIKGIYHEIEKEIPFPPGTLYPRILERVKTEPRISLNFKWKGYIDRIRQPLRGLFRSPRLSWGLVAVQLVIILVLAFGLSEGDRFRTLTSRETLPREGARIHLIFDQDSLEKEIREVLNQVDAIIVRGPSPEGLYTIEVKDDDEMERVLNLLKKSKIVRFAEKVQ
jgi:hypothetical protein